MGPAKSTRGFSPPSPAPGARQMLSHWRRPGGGAGKVHFPGGERRDRSARRPDGRWEGGSLRGVLQPAVPGPLPDRGLPRPPCGSGARPPWRADWVDCSQCSLTARLGRPGVAPEQALKVLGDHVGTPTDPS